MWGLVGNVAVGATIRGHAAVVDKMGQAAGFGDGAPLLTTFESSLFPFFMA